MYLSLLSNVGPQLKVVSTMSVGYDHISLPETMKRWGFQVKRVGSTPWWFCMMDNVLHSHRKQGFLWGECIQCLKMNYFSCHSDNKNIGERCFIVMSWEQDYIHNEESNLRPSDCMLWCSTTEPQKLYGEWDVLHAARISNVDSVMFVNRIRKMGSF